MSGQIFKVVRRRGGERPSTYHDLSMSAMRQFDNGVSKD